MVKFNFGLGGDDQDSAQGDGTAVPTPSGQDDGATPVITEPPVVEPVIEEDNGTPTEAPMTETPANPFADTTPQTEAPATEAPQTEAPVVETKAPVITEAPVVETEAPAETPNPFSLGSDEPVVVEEVKPVETEAPVVEEVAPLTTPTPSPFKVPDQPKQSFEKPKKESDEPLITTAVIPTTNDEPKEDTKIETPKEEKVPAIKIDDSASKSSKDNPLATLKLVKQEITDYVASHKENIKKYQGDIRDLEKKIQEEKTELSKKRSEFSGLLKDMESLTQDFGSGNGNGGNKPNGTQNRKPDFRK